MKFEAQYQPSAMADNSDSDSAPPPPPQAVIEVSAFANYLQRVVPVLLENADDTPQELFMALKDKQSIECMKKFISDPQIPCLLVQRLTTKGGTGNSRKINYCAKE